MRIYLASSWRNKERVKLAARILRSAGHNPFDFTDPGPQHSLPKGFHWSEIDPEWESWDPVKYRTALRHPLARAGLSQDFAAMIRSDACVAIQPFGRSASLELGWFIGRARPAIVLLASGEPELMFGLATLVLDLRRRQRPRGCHHREELAMILQTGLQVDIFEDPISRRRHEGVATIRRILEVDTAAREARLEVIFPDQEIVERRVSWAQTTQRPLGWNEEDGDVWSGSDAS